MGVADLKLLVESSQTYSFRRPIEQPLFPTEPKQFQDWESGNILGLFFAKGYKILTIIIILFKDLKTMERNNEYIFFSISWGSSCVKQVSVEGWNLYI